MELGAFVFILSVAFAIPIALAGIFHLLICVYDAMSGVKLEKNILMISLLQNIEKGMIRSLYISSKVVYFNFNITEQTKTTTTTYSDGSRSSYKRVGYICHMSPPNTIDFNKMGYQSISKRNLRQYKRQLIRKLHSLPQVANVESHQNLTFEFSDGGYVTQQEKPGYEEIWIINYQYAVKNISQPSGGKRIG